MNRASSDREKSTGDSQLPFHRHPDRPPSTVPQLPGRTTLTFLPVNRDSTVAPFGTIKRPDTVHPLAVFPFDDADTILSTRCIEGTSGSLIRETKLCISGSRASVSFASACSKVSNEWKTNGRRTRGAVASRENFRCTRIRTEWRIGCAICFSYGRGALEGAIILIAIDEEFRRLRSPCYGKRWSATTDSQTKVRSVLVEPVVRRDEP